MDASPAHILVVDDDTRLRTLLRKFLTEQGFVVSAAADAAQARELLSLFTFDAMVLDVMMPGESGTALAQSLKDHPTPMLMLSALGEAQHRIEGLEAGALDYLSKPFEPRELVLRINGLLRRQPVSDAPSHIRFGDYIFDPKTERLMKGAEEIRLTTAEMLFIKTLTGSGNQPVSRETLAALTSPPMSERSVDVQITRLRKKLDSDGKASLIRTLRGAGYVLKVE